jgi:hypothetical protein
MFSKKSGTIEKGKMRKVSFVSDEKLEIVWPRTMNNTDLMAEVTISREKMTNFRLFLQLRTY